MAEIYVTTRDDGYINGWYNSKPPEDAQLIDSPENLKGNLDCIRIKEGKAVFDKEKYDEIQKGKENSTDEISNLKREVTALGGSV